MTEPKVRAADRTREPDPFDDESFWDYDEGPEEHAAAGASLSDVRPGSVSHRRNIATTGAFVLHDGPKVRVAGKTTLIYDAEHKPRKVNLQIARLERSGKAIPEWRNLPAAIYLEGAEVEELYAKIAEARLALPELGNTDYILIRVGADPDIAGLSALIQRVASDPEQFRPLATLVGTAQLDALRAVVNLGRFTAARAELAAMIDANPPEQQFQRWFEDNEWVFGSEYVGRLKKPRHISADSQIDLMFLAVDGFADIFELKRPVPNVLVKTPDRNFYQPSGDLNAAFAQAVHYLAEADNNAFINQVRRNMPMYKPRVRLVIGRSHDWDPAAAMAYREITAAWSRIEFLTYDMVLQRIDLLIKTMSREMRAASDKADVSGSPQTSG